MTAHTTPTAEDDRAIAELLDAMVRAWDDGDADAYASLFTEDASYVMFAGGVDVGRSAIAAAHVPVFTKWRRGGRMAMRVTGTRMATPDVAIVLAEGGVGTGRRVTMDKVQTFTLVRTGDGWRCAAFQNTRRRPLLLRLMRAGTP